MLHLFFASSEFYKSYLDSLDLWIISMNRRTILEKLMLKCMKMMNVGYVIKDDTLGEAAQELMFEGQ